MKLNCSNDLAGSDLGKAIVCSSLPVRGYTKNKKETRNHKFRFFVIRCYESTRNQPVTDRNSVRSWFAIMSPTTDAFLHRGAKPLLLGIHFHCSARWYREYRVKFESSRQLLSHDHTPGSYHLLIAICITNKYLYSILRPSTIYAVGNAWNLLDSRFHSLSVQLSRDENVTLYSKVWFTWFTCIGMIDGDSIRYTITLGTVYI